MSVKEMLQGVPIFADLGSDDLDALVDRCRRFTFAPGEVIIEEGATDTRMYVILTGQAEVLINRGRSDEKELAALGPKDFVGEMAIIDGLPRSAWVVAQTDLEAVSLDEETIRDLISKNPTLALEMMQNLSRRLRAVNAAIHTFIGGTLPVCNSCKKVKTDDGKWLPVVEYLRGHTEAEFNHRLCPECARRQASTASFKDNG